MISYRIELVAPSNLECFKMFEISVCRAERVIIRDIGTESQIYGKVSIR